MSCKHRFRHERRERSRAESRFWFKYVFRKQTLRDLAYDYHHSHRTLRKLLNAYIPPQKVHHPRSVHLLADSTFFGERTEDTDWAVTVLKDDDMHEDLWWEFIVSENTSTYQKGRKELESLGYRILSVTGDGFSGIRTAFFGIPFQMCHVHMERIVIRGTTLRPKLEAGVVLLALVRTLFDEWTTKDIFFGRIQAYWLRYEAFLNERTTSPVSGESFWTHEELRKSFMSLQRLSQYLFTFEKDPRIPKTTNALEGQFSNLKTIVSVHRGTARKHKEKIIHSILLESTIAPKRKKRG